MPLKVKTITNGISVDGSVATQTVAATTNASMKHLSVGSEINIKTRIAIGEGGGGGCKCVHLPYEDACEILMPWEIKETNLQANASSIIVGTDLQLGRYASVDGTNLIVEENEYER